MLQRQPDYQSTYDRFVWEIPVQYNIAQECCERHLPGKADAPALLEWREGQSPIVTTFGQLAERSNRLANLLANLGLTTGERIGIILPQSVDTAAAHLAIYKSAMIAVPLARLFAPDAIAFRLQRSGVAAVITNAEGAQKIATIRDRLPDLRHVLVTGNDPQLANGETGLEQALALQPGRFAVADTGPDTPALIIFTSGTTGQPKGALHGHKVLAGHLPGVQMHHEFLPQAGDIAWTPADWAWAGGLLNVLLPCLHFGVPVVHGGLERFEPARAFSLLEEMQVANAFIPPTALRLMQQVEAPRKHYRLALRTVGSGGESLGRQAFEWAQRELGMTINEFYGQTECNLVLGSCAALDVTRPGAIGKPTPGHTVAVVRADGSLCEAGERGEVAIQRPDPVMFLGYWQDDEATAKKFVGDWMLTGDQCVMDGDGYFHFVGRDDDIINSAGYRVGPGEIEDALATHRAVKLSAAVAKPDPVRTEIIKAYVVLADGVQPSPALAEEIRLHVKARMAANLFPREIEFVDEIPLTTTGKVIRRLFRDKARQEAEASG